MGANDTITTDFELKIGMKTDRNTVEYISIPHPKQNLSEATVKAAAEYLITQNIIWDKESQSYTGVTTAYTESKSVTDFDLS